MRSVRSTIETPVSPPFAPAAFSPLLIAFFSLDVAARDRVMDDRHTKTDDARRGCFQNASRPCPRPRARLPIRGSATPPPSPRGGGCGCMWCDDDGVLWSQMARC